MAQIKGTNVIAPVVPLDTADVHPSHEALYGKGGYRTVATTADRDAIPAARREDGMLVYVTDDETIYTLGADLTTWAALELGGGQPDAHASTHAATGSDPITVSASQISGGSLPNGAALDFSNGTTDSEVGAWGFGVELTGQSGQYATVEYNAVTVSGTSGSTTLTPSGLTLPNATQVVVGSLDNMTGGANGISLICAVGYELNWQGGRLRSVQVGGDGSPQTIYCDSAIQFPGTSGSVTITGDGITFPDGSTQTTAWLGSYTHSHGVISSDGTVAGWSENFGYLRLSNAGVIYADAQVPGNQVTFRVSDVDTDLSQGWENTDYVNLVDAITFLRDYKADVSHQHVAADITDFSSAVVAAAPPTTDASLLTSGTLPDSRLSSNIARTSDVTSAVAAVVNAAPASLDTLKELADALGNDANFASTVTNSLAGKVSTSDSRLYDSREWSADTISQAEAEAGTATTRRAFTALRVFQAVAAWWAGSAAKAKLDGIATGATANATDAQLRDRATHTGTQAASTITGLASVATSGAYGDLSGRPTLGTAASQDATAFAAASHSHGSVTNDGRIGTESGLIVVTGAGGQLTTSGSLLGYATIHDVNIPDLDTSAFPTDQSLGDVLLAIDTVVSGKAANSHTHGNISSAGLVNGNTAADRIVVTTTGGALTTAATIDVTKVTAYTGSMSQFYPLVDGEVLEFLARATEDGVGDAIQNYYSYTLPSATSSVLGGVKQGSNVTIGVDGTISVAAPVTSLPYSSITGTPTLATVATSGSAADLSGTLSASRLPTSGVTAGTYTSVTVDATGRVTAGSSPAGYTLPTASASVLGGVKIGSGISIDGNGVISASSGYTLPNATTSTLGGVIVGSGLSVSSGTVSANVTSVAGRTGAVTIAAADVSGLASVATSGAYSSLTGTPSTLPPTAGSVTDSAITSGGLSASSINWTAITPWAPSTAYAKGDLVSYLGVAYRRSAAGTSGSTFNTANWQQVTPSLFAVNSDTVGSTSYIGRAVSGSATSASVWTIRRTVLTSAGAVSATTTAANVKWDDRLTASYS